MSYAWDVQPRWAKRLLPVVAGPAWLYLMASILFFDGRLPHERGAVAVFGACAVLQLIFIVKDALRGI